jgi:hypothetical protein
MRKKFKSVRQELSLFEVKKNVDFFRNAHCH